MLDRIYDLKNNKQKLNDTDTSLETAKKFVKNLVSKRGVHGGASQLRVSWYVCMIVISPGLLGHWLRGELVCDILILTLYIIRVQLY